MVVRSGAPGALTSLFVRGGESDYNKVLLDGVPLNEPGGAFYLNNLTTENLERVEILRGAYSSLFGSDAMGSVIQLFTRRGARDGAAARSPAQIEGGTYGTFHGNAAVSGGTERFDYSFGAARSTRDNRVPNSAFGNTTLQRQRRRRPREPRDAQVSGPRRARAYRHAGDDRLRTSGPGRLLRSPRQRLQRQPGRSGQPRTFRQRAGYSLTASNQQSTNLVQDPDYTADL